VSDRWTEGLIEPLAAATRDGDWERVDEAQKGSAAGGWNLATELAWFHLPASGGPLQPLPLLDDPKLKIRAALDDWLTQGATVTLLARRVANRAVFLVAASHGVEVAKLYKRDRDLLRRWHVLPHEGEPWRLPRVLGWDSQRRLLRLERVALDSLHAHWRAGRCELADAERLADLLRWIASASLPEGFPVHGPDEEIALLEGQVAVAARTRRTPSAAAREQCERVTAALAGDAPRDPVLCHRDLHDKQVLWGEGRGALLDLDLAAAGPPALDPGNLLAHVRLRALQGLPLTWQPLASSLARQVLRDRALGQSLRLWTAAALLRLALIYGRREHRPGLLEDLLRSSQDALAGVGEWAGLLD
jgi:hypothetical protein